MLLTLDIVNEHNFYVNDRNGQLIHIVFVYVVFILYVLLFIENLLLLEGIMCVCISCVFIIGKWSVYYEFAV